MTESSLPQDIENHHLVQRHRMLQSRMPLTGILFFPLLCFPLLIIWKGDNRNPVFIARLCAHYFGQIMENYHYFAFGLSISSEICLPELIVPEQPPATTDVTIRRGHISRPVNHQGADDFTFSTTEQEAYLHWDEIADFKVCDGSEITVDALPSTQEQAVRLPLLGTVLAALLIQRGLFVLHASAIAINNRAAIFLGNKGQGKSTMAATLYGRGHNLITDDLVVLESNADGSKSVLSGFPQFKLWPDSALSSLGEDPANLPRLAAQYEKRARRVTSRFSSSPVPLSRVYVLFGGQEPLVAPMGSSEALAHLITHSYAARFGKNFLQGQAAVSHFRSCSDLVSRVRPQRLERHYSLDALADVANVVEKDVAAAQLTSKN